MPFAVEFRDDGRPVRWRALTGERAATDPPGATATLDDDYRPAMYVAARDDRTRYLDWLADALASDPKLAGVERVPRRRDLRADEPSPMLRVALDRVEEVRQLAREIRTREHEVHAPGTLSLYDVDLDPGFRYCLDTGRSPVPARSLRRLSLSLPDPALADDDLTELRVDGEPAGATEGGVRRRVERALDERDPDVLVVSSGGLVPLLADTGVDPGRDSSVYEDRPAYRKLAGESTYESYGRVGHSPARYDVPGRAIVDRSSSFLLGESGMAGIRYFVDRARKPIQELARDSIGGVLTAIEVCEARERGVPAPWQKRQTEDWKPVDVLHAADRGGFTFQPEPGVHDAVHELDFASLYPNVIREYGVSPDTVRCGCHDRADVPELGYSVCDRDAFLGEVLGPLLDDRARWKARLDATGAAGGDDGSDAGESDCGRSPAERDRLDAKIDAVKWVLVSSFGYQGYRHAKFGRIEVHEAINAYAREVMLRAKEAFEAGGWRVVHGIVDSLWVTPDPDPDREQRPVREVAAEVTDDVGIRLEHEGHFDWVAFCPRKRASGAALMRYFGRWADDAAPDDDPPPEDRYKFRGVEARQRSTCEFVTDAQRDLVDVFDRERDRSADSRAAEAVCDRLQTHLARLRRGTVPAADLAVRQRVSKRPGEYTRATRARAALERARSLGLERHPGQSVEYVVVDDDRSGPERVRLAFEDGTAYDPDFYADRLVRACESVLSPLGWDESRVRRYLAAERDATLSSFTGPGGRRE
ncbi:MAG: type B DNA-directed DNA polymerase [Haloarculaceae archaeon]